MSHSNKMALFSLVLIPELPKNTESALLELIHEIVRISAVSQKAY